MRIQHVLACVPFLFTSCADDHHGHDHGHDHGADGHTHAEDTEVVIKCGPCGMDMAADAERTEIAGMEFVFCGGACKDAVMKDPQRFKEFAIAH